MALDCLAPLAKTVSHSALPERARELVLQRLDEILQGRALVRLHEDLRLHAGDDAQVAETRQLLHYFDGQKKRNLVLTFGGGVQEVQRELIAMFGLGLPRVPR